MEGKVKYYNFDRGYGFISNTESGKDIFFHVSDLENGNPSNLLLFPKVEFTLGNYVAHCDNSERVKATKVRIID